ncbi:hypothetical protein FQZ97_1217380 [compost metagenome]
MAPRNTRLYLSHSFLNAGFFSISSFIAPSTMRVSLVTKGVCTLSWLIGILAGSR